MKCQWRVFMAVATCFAVMGCNSAVGEVKGINLQTEQRLIIENLNMSAEAFWSSYMSKDKAQRQAAEMYLAGVLDAGEGNVWCSYSIALPGSVQELIYIGFKDLPQDKRKNRASVIVNQILSSQLPCKESQK